MRSKASAHSGYATEPKQAMSRPPHPGTATYETPTASSTRLNEHRARRWGKNHGQRTTHPPPARSPTNHRSSGGTYAIRAPQVPLAWRRNGRLVMLINMQPQQTDPPTAPTDRKFDVLIVGGGAAGLTAALMLGRARRSVLVIDSGQPRNRPAAHMHGFPSRDGTSPSEFLRPTRAQLGQYGVAIPAAEVRTAATMPDGVQVTTTAGEEFVGRRLLACTSMYDQLADIPGLHESWGKDVVHCPYCHGWEIQDQRIGVLATGPMSIHQAMLFRQWSHQLTLLLHTHEPPGPEQAEALAARGIRTIAGEVAEVEAVSGRLVGVRLTSGDRIVLDALVVAPKAVPRADFLEPLGLTPSPHPSGIRDHIAADEPGPPTAPGVWVAGNLANPLLNVLGSADSGSIAAGAINADLIAEETEAAIHTVRQA